MCKNVVEKLHSVFVT